MKDLEHYHKVIEIAKYLATHQIGKGLIHFSDTAFDKVKSQSQELFYATKFFEDKIQEHNSKIRTSLKKIENIRIRYEYQYIKIVKSVLLKDIDFQKLQKIVSENPNKDWYEIAKEELEKL